jgi:uncharacterized membrane protein
MPLHLFKTLIRGYLFWPLVMVALAMVLAAIAANVDDHLAAQDEIIDALNVLRLSNDDARAVLSTVASAAITVLSLVYSMTLVVFTLAASALGNRIIRTFGDNRLGQITAGLLAGTFIFALATLYLAPPDRPPLISTALAVVLAIISVILLIAFVNNVSHRIQIDNELARIQRLLSQSIINMAERLNRSASAEGHRAAEEAVPHALKWRAPKTGYITALEFEKLSVAMKETDAILIMHAMAGDFVLEGDQLATVRAAKDASIAATLLATKAYRFIDIRDARAPEGDVKFNVHLIVEIALRALSPGVNDAYTAVAAIDQLSASIVTLMQTTTAQARLRDEDGYVRVVADLLSVRDIVGSAIHPIRRAAADNVLVMMALARALKRLADHSNVAHGPLLRKHIRLCVNSAQDCLSERADRDEVAELLWAAWRATKRLPA